MKKYIGYENFLAAATLYKYNNIFITLKNFSKDENCKNHEGR